MRNASEQFPSRSCHPRRQALVARVSNPCPEPSVLPRRQGHQRLSARVGNPCYGALSRFTETRHAFGFAVAAIFVLSTAMTSCKREDRGFRVDAPAQESAALPAVIVFNAAPTTETSHIINGYDEN